MPEFRGQKEPLHTAVVQNSAGDDVAENLARVDQLVAEAGEADLVALPEVFAFRGGEKDYREIAEPIDGPIIQRLAQFASLRSCWVLVGSIIEKADDGVFNTAVLINRSGETAASYRKIHLFEAHLDDGMHVREADSYDAGSDPVMADLEGWKVGLSICYDLRFPELYRGYAAHGCDLLFVPANFTQRTGKDHWETLVRARAIENQCFVVAPNQCGSNPASDVASYGHSMVVGPWGEVLCEAGDAEAVITARLDPGMLDETRKRVPALGHRRL